MSLFLYHGQITEVSVVKSARLKAGLCHSLGRDVQPVQLRILLSHFLELETNNWHEVFESETVNGVDNVYSTQLAEFVCGGLLPDGNILPKAEMPEDKLLQLVTNLGSLTVDFTQAVEMQWLVGSLELTPKFRKKDGLHMRSAPPDWEGSRRIWRLQNATLCGLTYTPSLSLSPESGTVQRAAAAQTEEETCTN